MEKADFIARDRCIGCGSRDLVELSNGLFTSDPLRSFIAADPWGEDPLPFLAGQKWSYVRCCRCAQAFHRYILSPRWNERRFAKWMTRQAISEFEASHMNADRLFDRAVQYTQHVLQLDALTKALRDGSPMRVLDFGCGNGEFVMLCGLFGFEAFGIDRSTSRREAQPFLRIFSDLNELQRHAGDSFDVVTLFEVLEHLEDPLGNLKSLHGYLSVDGILVLETPDCSGVTDISTQDDYRKIHPLDHINAFTPAKLRALAARAGFVPISKPVSHVTVSPVRVAKTELKRLLSKAMKPTTQQYFRKVSIPGKAGDFKL